MEVEYTRLSDIWISEDYLSSLYEVFIKFPQEQGLQMQSEVCVMVDEELVMYTLYLWRYEKNQSPFFCKNNES